MTNPEKTIPKLVLVDGDPILGMDAIVAMKNQWMQSHGGFIQWMEISPPTAKKTPEFLNSLDGDVSTSDIGGEHKVIFLRGLASHKQFKEGLLKIATSIADGNTLLIFDEKGVIRSEKKGSSDNQKSGWDLLRDLVAKTGIIEDVPPPFEDLGPIPWGMRFGTGHVKAVVNEFAKRGKKVSPQIVRDIFLEMVMMDWSYVLKEIDKLAELVKGETITSDDILKIVFPWTQQHAVFEFSNAFNSGDYNKTMDSYDELVACKIPNAMIFSSCMKLLRWQLIASHLISYGQPLPSALNAIGNLMTQSHAVSKTEHLKRMKSYLFKKIDKEASNDKEVNGEGITPFMSHGVSSFVKDVFSRKVPIRSGKLGTLPFVKAAMTRYLAVFEGMESLRLCGDPSRARSIFRQAMQKVCWRM